MTQTIDVAESNQWRLILLGNFPYWTDYCSGHIHTSIKGGNRDSVNLLRKKLFNAQPLIALLSANAPIRNGIYQGSDVRLLFSSWAQFTPFNDSTGSHWLAIARGNNRASTVEVRIPSAGPLHQIIGIAALIRVLIEDQDTIYENVDTEENYNRVIKWGTKALFEIKLPTSITYHGLAQRRVFVKAVDLWKNYLKDNRDLLKEATSTLSSRIKHGVRDFYEMIANGVSISDRVLGLWQNMRGRQKKAIELEKLTKRSYQGEPYFLNFPLPKRQLTLNKDYVTVEDLKEIIQNIRLNLGEDQFDPDFYSIINECLTEADLRRVILSLLYKDQIQVGRMHLIKYSRLNDLNVLKVKGDTIQRGENFEYAVQLLRECEIL